MLLSRAAISRKSLQERYKTILLLDERSSGQNFSLSLSLVCFSLKKTSFCSSLWVRSFCFPSSSLLPPFTHKPQTKRESILYLHLSNDDDAFLFCEDSPNGGGRYYQSTLKFSLSLVSRLRFCCRRRLRRRLSRVHDRFLFVWGLRYFLMERKR